MARRIRRKDLKRDEIAEAAFDLGHWIEAHWKRVLAGVAGIVVLALAFFAWWALDQRKRVEAADRLAHGQKLYRIAAEASFPASGELDEALLVFEEVIARAGRGEAARVAQFYRGATLYRLGRLDEAIAGLEELMDAGSGSATLLGSSRTLLASAYVQQGDVDRAVSLLEAAAGAETKDLPPEQALMQIGRIYQGGGRLDEARTIWQRVVDEYPQTTASFEARQLLAPRPPGS